MFSFNPKSEQELQSANLLEPGTYDFQVTNAIEKVSKSGNQMIELTVKVWDQQGRERSVFDYLIDIEACSYKIKHFCDATGMEDQYKEGKFSMMDCIDKSGKLKLIIKKDKTGQYSDRNAVADYMKQNLEAKPKVENDIQDDDFPF